MLVKFEQNLMIQTTQNSKLFDKKIRLFKTIFVKLDAILEEVSVD